MIYPDQTLSPSQNIAIHRLLQTANGSRFYQSPSTISAARQSARLALRPDKTMEYERENYQARSHGSRPEKRNAIFEQHWICPVKTASLNRRMSPVTYLTPLATPTLFKIGD